MPAAQSNLLIEIGANLNLVVNLQDQTGANVNLVGYHAKFQVRGHFGDAAAILSLDDQAVGGITLGNAAFNGSTATNVLTLTSTATGSFLLGSNLYGTGIPAGTLINTLLTGTLGQSGSTYGLSTSPGTVGSAALTSSNGAITLAASAALTHAINTTLLDQALIPSLVALDALGNAITKTGYKAPYALEITDSGGNVTRVLEGSAVITPEVCQ